MSNTKFNNEEIIVINSISDGFDNENLTREKMLTSLEFSYSISTEPSILDLLDGLKLKLQSISDEEWENIKRRLPLPSDYDAPYSP